VNAYAPVLTLCRVLMAHGHDPATPLNAYRGGVLALKVRSIGEAARLTLNSKGTGFVTFRAPEEAISDVRSAPPARLPRSASAPRSFERRPPSAATYAPRKGAKP
jgi:hypothetical protein